MSRERGFIRVEQDRVGGLIEFLVDRGAGAGGDPDTVGDGRPSAGQGPAQSGYPCQTELLSLGSTPDPPRGEGVASGEGRGGPKEAGCGSVPPPVTPQAPTPSPRSKARGEAQGPPPRRPAGGSPVDHRVGGRAPGPEGPPRRPLPNSTASLAAHAPLSLGGHPHRVGRHASRRVPASPLPRRTAPPPPPRRPSPRRRTSRPPSASASLRPPALACLHPSRSGHARGTPSRVLTHPLAPAPRSASSRAGGR